MNESVESYLRRKIASLEKFFNSSDELVKVEAEVGRINRRHKTGEVFRAEINLSLGGKLLRAESEQDDLFAAIDEVRDVLEEEIKKFKNKKETVFIRGARSIKKKIGLSPLSRFHQK